MSVQAINDGSNSFCSYLMQIAVNNVILATLTHPYSWIKTQLVDQQSRLKSLLIVAARDISADLPNASAQSAKMTIYIRIPGDTEVSNRQNMIQ